MVHDSVLQYIASPYSHTPLANWAKPSRDRLLSLHDYVYKHVRFKGFSSARLFDDGVFLLFFFSLFRCLFLLASFLSILHLPFELI